MESTRKGLRTGDLEKDTYERLTCASCGQELTTRDDPDTLGRVRVCPECGREWQEVG